MRRSTTKPSPPETGSGSREASCCGVHGTVPRSDRRVVALTRPSAVMMDRESTSVRWPCSSPSMAEMSVCSNWAMRASTASVARLAKSEARSRLATARSAPCSCPAVSTVINEAVVASTAVGTNKRARRLPSSRRYVRTRKPGFGMGSGSFHAHLLRVKHEKCFTVEHQLVRMEPKPPRLEASHIDPGQVRRASQSEAEVGRERVVDVWVRMTRAQPWSGTRWLDTV